MKFKRMLGLALVVGGLLAFVAAPVSAEIYNDDFFFGSAGGVLDGGGSGYVWDSPTAVGGVWELYDQGPSEWYNQWFFDGNLRLDRHKEVWLDIMVYDGSGQLWDPSQPLPFDIVINWSNDLWDTSGDPLDRRPPNPDEEIFIERSESLATFFDPATSRLETFYVIPSLYNPEWVSIDIWPLDQVVDFWIEGSIEHSCVPEPSTLVIWSALGLVGITFCWRRRKAAKTG